MKPIGYAVEIIMEDGKNGWLQVNDGVGKFSFDSLTVFNRSYDAWQKYQETHDLCVHKTATVTMLYTSEV